MVLLCDRFSIWGSKYNFSNMSRFMDSQELSNLENRLWSAANVLWAGADLKPSQYSPLVLGLIFLRFADHRFSVAAKELEGKSTGRRSVGKVDYQARGVLFLPPESRYDFLLNLPEAENLGKKVDAAVKLCVENTLDLLPRAYAKDIYQQKCEVVFQHFLNNYSGAGRSIYAA